jgi:hypothetical protein
MAGQAASHALFSRAPRTGQQAGLPGDVTGGGPPGPGSGSPGAGGGDGTGTPWQGGAARTGDGGLLPSVQLPAGGGAIRGLGEKFAVDAATGTGALTVDLPLSTGRSGFTPVMGLRYDSAAGNGPLGFGWTLGVPAITRKTDKGLPLYCDGDESDVFILAGTEDLVPVLDGSGDRVSTRRTVYGTDYTVFQYRPRIEGLFAERDAREQVSGISHWRAISRDNVTTLYGADPPARWPTRQSSQDLLLAHLPGMGRQGQRRDLQLRGRGQRGHRPGGGARGEQDAADPRGPDLPQVGPLREHPALFPRPGRRAARRAASGLDVQRGARLR